MDRWTEKEEKALFKSLREMKCSGTAYVMFNSRSGVGFLTGSVPGFKSVHSVHEQPKYSKFQNKRSDLKYCIQYGHMGIL
jgi:hypothetical protein